MEIQSGKDSVGSRLNEDASEKEWTNLIIHKNSEILSRWVFRKCGIEFLKMRMDTVITAF